MAGGLNISQTDGRPMYLQIMEQIKQRIVVGDWQPGQEIPSIRGLAVATRVSVITVKRAYLELERAGIIVTRQGRGSFVADDVNLGPDLRNEALDRHLSAAAEIGLEMGLSSRTLVARLRDAIAEHGGES